MTGTGSSEILTGFVSILLLSFGFLIACPPPNPKVPVLFLLPPADLDLWCFKELLEPADLLLELTDFTFSFEAAEEDDVDTGCGVRDPEE